MIFPKLHRSSVVSLTSHKISRMNVAERRPAESIQAFQYILNRRKPLALYNGPDQLANSYTASLVLNKSVSLIGAGVTNTILQAPAGQRVLLVTGPVTSGAQIAHLTLQGGLLAAGNGGGVLVQAPAQPTLHHLLIQCNTVSSAAALGGGLFSATSLTLTQVDFVDNTAFAGFGGGLAGAGGAHFRLESLRFERNGADRGGGGLFADSADLFNSSFRLNVAGANAGRGGGAYLTTTAALAATFFDENQAFTDGGGLYAGGSVTVTGGGFFSHPSPTPTRRGPATGGRPLLFFTISFPHPPVSINTSAYTQRWQEPTNPAAPL